MLRSLITLALLVACLSGTQAALADDAPAAPPAAPAPSMPAPPPAPPAAAVVLDDVSRGCCPPLDPCRKRHLEVQGHVALLTPDPSGLASVDSGLPDQITWDAVDYDLAVGGRVAYTFPWTCWDVTVGGTWWGSWSDSASSIGTLASSLTPGGAPIVQGPMPVDLREEATLWDLSVALTTPFYCSPCFTAAWGWGARYLRFDEEASIQFPFGGAGPATARYEADMENGLLAAQLVGIGTWRLSPCWEFVARGSVFAGWMHRSGEIGAINIPLALVGTSDEDDDLGFGGELELALRWRSNSNWTVSVGYGLLLVGNVTRGHEAMDFANSATLDPGPVFRDDTLLAHRAFVSVGFEF